MPAIVSLAAPHELLPALRLALGVRTDPTADPCVPRTHESFTEVHSGSTGVFVARDGARMCGAILAQTMPGALGVMWPSRANSTADEDALVIAAGNWLRSRGVKVCQAFATAEERATMASLERHGFRHVTQLLFMRRTIHPEADGYQPSCIDGVYYHPDLENLFATLLLATLEESLDCPELNGSRTPAEIVAAFELPIDVPLWRFCGHADGERVGLTMAQPGPDGVLSLNYLGVVPDARGRGFGAKLLRVLLKDAAESGIGVVEVAVDVRNEPALRLYSRHGFTETDRRDVWLAHR